MKIFLTTLLLLISFQLQAQDFNFSPVGKQGEIQIYEEFSLSYSEEHEQPWWVSYYLTQDEYELAGRDRINTFITDTTISTGSATHDDYTNTGWDRGHMSRASYNKRSENAYRESFNMSNISPQQGYSFNRLGGDWFDLEELEIDFAYGLDEVYCVTGPIFEEIIEVIGDETAITVPGHFFKAFLNPDKTQTIGFIIANDPIDGTDLWGSAVSINELESRTGLNFFARLPNNTEKLIEATFELNYWMDIAELGRGER